MDLKAAPPSPQMQDVFGGWYKIATTAGRFASLVSKTPGLPTPASDVLGLLAALTDAQDSQSALLSSIKADTTALRNAPFKGALQSLDDARRVGPADPSWDRFLDRAEDKLSEARELESDPQKEALIEYDLGIVWLAKGHRGNARFHLEKCIQCADRVVNEYAEKASIALQDARPRDPGKKRRELPVGAKRALVAGTALLPGGVAAVAAAGAVKKGRKVAGRGACHDLKDFLDFYNLIQHTASAVSGAEPQYLKLEGPMKGRGPDYILRLR